MEERYGEFWSHMLAGGFCGFFFFWGFGGWGGRGRGGGRGGEGGKRGHCGFAFSWVRWWIYGEFDGYVEPRNVDYIYLCREWRSFPFP